MHSAKVSAELQFSDHGEATPCGFEICRAKQKKISELAECQEAACESEGYGNSDYNIPITDLDEFGGDSRRVIKMQKEQGIRPRARGKGRKRSSRRGRGRKGLFDCTLGYPGEGPTPPNSPMSTTSTSSSSSLSSQYSTSSSCVSDKHLKNLKKLKLKRQSKLQKREAKVQWKKKCEGKSVEEAVSACPADLKNTEAMDVPFPPDVAQPHPEKAPIDHAAEFEKIKLEAYQKATLSMATKNLESEADMKVVKRQISVIMLANKAHEHSAQAAEATYDIYRDAMKYTLEKRLTCAKEVAQGEFESTIIKVLAGIPKPGFVPINIYCTLLPFLASFPVISCFLILAGCYANLVIGVIQCLRVAAAVARSISIKISYSFIEGFRLTNYDDVVPPRLPTGKIRFYERALPSSLKLATINIVFFVIGTFSRLLLSAMFEEGVKFSITMSLVKFLTMFSDDTVAAACIPMSVIARQASGLLGMVGGSAWTIVLKLLGNLMYLTGFECITVEMHICAFFGITLAALMITSIEAKSCYDAVRRFAFHASLVLLGPFGPIIHALYNLCAKMNGRPDLMLFLEQPPIIESICLHGRALAKQVTLQDGFKCVRETVQCVEKFGMRQYITVKGYVPTVFRQCTHNEQVSMEGRVGKKLPYHTDEHTQSRVKKNWRRVSKKFVPHFAKLITYVRCGVPFKEWVAGFKPSKRNLLMKIKEEMDVLYKNKASSFIKVEKAVVTDISSHKWKDPRFIQGCPPQMSIEVGPFIRKFAKNMHKNMMPENYSAADLAAGRQIIYTCGMSGEDIGESFAKAINAVTSLKDPDDSIVFIEDDQSRFDLHLTEGPFKCLAALYCSVLPRRIRRKLLRNLSRGKSVLGTRYSIPYTMQSGWPDTSAGDTFINSIMKTHIHGLGKLWFSIVCGDDSVTITTQKTLKAMGDLEKAYADFGMEVEVIVKNDPLSVEFCSGRFQNVGSSYVLMPKVGRLLAKLGSDVKNRPLKHQEEWLRGIASTMENFGHYDPIIKNLAQQVRAVVGQGSEISDRTAYDKFVDLSRPQPSDYDLAVFYDHHYSMSAADIQRASSLTISSLPVVIDDVLIDYICSIDN